MLVRGEVQSYSATFNSPRSVPTIGGRTTNAYIVITFMTDAGTRRASLFFCPEPVVDFVGKGSAVRGLAYIALHISEFERYLHLLQTETPLTFSVAFDDDNSTVSSFRLSTSREETGEGFEDSDSDAAD